MATRAIEIEDAKAKNGEVVEAVYEHPFIVRLCHWVNATALFVLVGSGLQIFRAFPSFGAKIPQKDLLHWPKGPIRAARYSRRLANGAPLFFLWPQACGEGSLQSTAKACLHLRFHTWCLVGSYGHRYLEAGAIFLAGVADGRLPLCPVVAFCGYVGAAGFRVRTFGHGGAARLEQFCFNVHRMEEGP